MDVRFTSPTTLADALTAAAAGSRPVAGGTDLVVGTRQGKWSLPENLVALDRIAELRGIVADGGRPPDRCDDEPRRSGRSSGHPRALDGHRRRGLDRRLAGDAARRDARRQHRQRVAGRRDERAAALLRCPGRAPLERRATAGSRSPTCSAVPAGRRSVRTSSSSPSCCPSSTGAGSCYVRLEFRRQMEIAVVGATAVVQPRGRRRPRRPDRHHRPRPDGPAGRRRRGRARRDGWRARRPRRRRAGWRPRPRRRSRTSAPRSSTAGRWRPSSSVEPSPERSPELAGRRSRSPPAPALFGAR